MSNSATSVEDELDRMWKTQVDSVQSGTSTIKDLDIIVVDDKKDFKKHNDLPIARIKRIMKSDQDVRMISAETPVFCSGLRDVYHGYNNSFNAVCRIRQ